MVLRAGFHGTVGQSSAQVINGSLKFDKSKSQYLQRTPGSAGNRSVYTGSVWVKRTAFAPENNNNSNAFNYTIFSAGTNSANNIDNIKFYKNAGTDDANKIEYSSYVGSYQYLIYTNAKYRDPEGWYHVVWNYDGTTAKLYVNGEQITSFDTNTQNGGSSGHFNNNVSHVIGHSPDQQYNMEFDGFMSQFYWIDGQALGPEYFGFTDPLTNTWRPKKYTGTFGTNGFWLPMDGKSPIGQDKSGKGNHWTPVNFGGSAGVDQATGALPILEGAGGAVANVATRNDAYAANLVLALPLVGNKEDVVASINSAQTNVTVTNNGSVPFQTTQSNFYGGSAFFEDSSSDNLTFTNFGSRFEFTGDYTIEAWIYPTDSSAADGSIFVENSGSNYFAFNFDPGTQFNIYNNSSSPSWSPSTNLPAANKWSHIALVRSGSTQTIYVNGSSIATNTASGTHGYASPSFARIGGGASSGLDSYVQDLRVYKGVAKYTENFVPASTNPDVLPDTPSGVSGKSKLTKITDGAVSFDGTDYLTVADGSNDFSFGTGAYTVEGYLYPTTLTGNGDANPRFFCCGTPSASSNRNQLQIAILSTGAIRLDTNSANYASTAGDVAVNKWQHIAVARDGSGNLKAFVDGRQVISQTSVNNDITNNDGISLGIEAGHSSRFTGFMSNVRILKGTALYTSAFTPPERTLTNITNTKLLCCQSTVEPGGAAVAPNVSGINNGTQWSNYLTGAGGFQSSYPAINAFNGIITGANTSRSTNNGEKQAFAPPTGIPYSSKVEVWTWYQGTVSLNGGSGVSVSDDQNWREIATGSGTLNSLLFSGNSGNSIYLAGIRIDSTTILLDPVAPNGDSAATTFNPSNTDINTVRGQETGYPTLNPLQQSLNSTPTISNGNLTLTKSAGGAEWTNTGCTMTIPKSGKWFWEITWTSVGGGSVARCGVADSNDYEFNRNTSGTGLPWMGSGTGTSWSCDVRGYKYHDGTETTGYLPAFAAGDVMGILLDRDENTITYTRNGFSGGVAHSNVSPDFVTPGFGLHAGTTNSLDVNFGQKPFKFPPPDGFQPLNGTTILPETVIARSSQYFGATTYSGSTGAGTIKDENIEFTPDFVWVKDRTGTEPHALYDTVRGAAGNGNFYRLSTTSQNGNNSPTNELTSMIRGGFTANNNGHIFYNGKNYVSWMWKAGGSSNTFNVDDVGYANASDVNMSVGALNNIAFNKSQAWSSNASGGGNAANAFNGVGPKKDNYSHSGSALTLTFSPALTGKIVVYGGTGAGSHNSVTTDTFTLSDGSVLSSQEKYDVFPYFTKLDFGEKSGITSLVCSAGYTLYGITLDGKLLVDSGVSINAPTIANSKCSVGTKQGFSIINFTNTNSDSTHAHGLTQKPDFIVMKKTNGTSHWPVYHSSMGPEYGYLNLANAFGVGSGEMWNYTEPNDYYVTLKGEPNTFGSAGDVIMYCWHNVPGLQKFGFYVGNSDNNGPFIETGFRPALVWVKSDSTAGQEWVAYDSKTAPINEMSTFRYIETTANDQSGRQVDFLSNGFKFRNGSSGATNNGSRTYIYCAWAEAPAFNLYGGQSSAR